MSNPIGCDGAPMERHHIGRCDGETKLIDRITHQLIHQGETDAIREVMRLEGVGGNPTAWTAKRES